MRLVLLLFGFVATWFCPNLGALNAQTKSIEYAVEQLNEKRKGVDCVYYKAEGTVTFPKQTIRYPNDVIYEIYDTETVKPASYSVLIDFEQPRYRCLESTYLPHRNKSSTETIEGFNKRIWIHGFESEVWTRWDLRLNAEIIRKDDGEPRIYHGVWPFFESLGYLPWHRNSPRSFHRPLEIEDFVERFEKEHNGKKCIVLRTRNMDPLPRYHECWIDPDNWNIVRDDEWDGGSLQSSIELAYRRDEYGRWLLESYQLKKYCYWPDSPASRVYDYRVTEFKLNPDYDSLAHEFDMEKGVTFSDR